MKGGSRDYERVKGLRSKVMAIFLWLDACESSGLSISTRITLEIELFTFLNSFAGTVKT